MLAGDVDEGLPFGVGEVYACLAICCCYQVSYDPIVLTAPYIRLAPYARRAISISALQLCGELLAFVLLSAVDKAPHRLSRSLDACGSQTGRHLLRC